MQRIAVLKRRQVVPAALDHILQQREQFTRRAGALDQRRSGVGIER